MADPLHHEDGSHRTTPPSAKGRALEAHERRLRAHLASLPPKGYTAESLNIEPTENFVAPNMALDTQEPDLEPSESVLTADAFEEAFGMPEAEFGAQIKFTKRIAQTLRDAQERRRT